MKLVPHGYLTDLLPAEGIDIEASTVAECINGVCKQTKALDPKPGKGRHHLRVDGFEEYDALFAPTDVEEIHVYPDFSGAKSGFVKVLIGTALIAASFIPGLQSVTLTAGVTLGGTLFAGGVSIALGGLTQIISPSPTFGANESGQQDSFVINAKENTVKAGTRIPVIYGRHRFGGHFVSVNVDAIEINQSGESLQRDVTAPPPESVSNSLMYPDVKIQWDVPSDSTIKAVTGEDATGESFHPFPNGRDHITGYRIERYMQRDVATPNGETTNIVTEEVADADPGAREITLDMPQLSEPFKYGVRIEYDTGDVSAEVTGSFLGEDRQAISPA